MTTRDTPGEELRETQRSYIHRLDSEYAWIISRVGEFRARVVDLTPKGIGLVVEGTAVKDSMYLQKGDLVSLRVERGGHPVTVKARLATRSETLLEKDVLRLGFRIESDDEALISQIPPGEVRLEESRPRRFSLDQAPILECESDDYLRLGQKAFYKIRDVSLKGALLETSARNKFLLPNLQMPLIIYIPGHGKFTETVKVRRVEVGGDRYWVGLEWVNLQSNTIEALGDFCVNFAENVSYQIMLEEGFPVRVLEEAMTVQAETTKHDYMQILQLRLQHAHENGERLEDSDPWAFMKLKDSDARHVSVKIGKRVVASARLLEVSSDGLALSCLVSDKEFSRAVKGPRVLSVLWREILRSALMSGSKKLELTEPGPIPKFVKRLGAKEKDGLWQIDLQLLAEGKRVWFGTWALSIAPVIATLVRDKKLTITSSTQAKLYLASAVQILFKKNQSL